MDPHQVFGVYLVPDLFRGHVVFPDAIDLANVEFYLAIIGLEEAIMVEHGLGGGRYRYVEGLEPLYEIEI